MRRNPKRNPVSLASLAGRALPWVRAQMLPPWRPLILLVGVSTLSGLLYLRILDERVPLRLNQSAPRDIRAHADAWYTDTAATEKRKEEARASIPLEYDERNAAAARETRNAISSIFMLANEARRDEATDLARLNHLRTALQISLSHETLSTLVMVTPSDFAIVEDLAQTLAANEMKQPIRDYPSNIAQARQRIAEAGSKLQDSPPLVSAAVEIAQKTIRENQLHNPSRTQAKQDEAVATVEPVRARIRRNELIIEARDRVEQVHIDMLQALGMSTPARQGLASRVVASVAAIVGLLGVFLFYLSRFRPQLHRSSRCVGLLVGCMLAAAVVARLGAGGDYFEATELAAVAALSIVLAVLLDIQVAMVASVFMAFFADMAAPGSDPRLLIAATVAGIVAAFATSPGGTRASVFVRTMVVCGLANGFLVAAIGSVFGVNVLPEQVGFAALGGVLASVLAAGAVGFLERPLKITTDVRLLELSSPQAPMLRRLALEAPGTYASSVAVANLAESAAEAVGADPLLTRVGSYYHDIGKLKRPYYFVENQQGLGNPHNRLTPHLSAKVIISHVRDGLELADEIGLPAEVRAFIAEHHGTTMVEFFYEKALQSTAAGESVLEAAFRYDGPKPRTRETAILMIADTVEAASRTVANPDLDSLQTLVTNLIQHKVDDGQFDDCPLTFHDVTVIREAMVRALLATFHQRVRYPAQLEEEARAEERVEEPTATP